MTLSRTLTLLAAGIAILLNTHHTAAQTSEIKSDEIHTLLVRVNDEWGKPPVANMAEGDEIVIRFDRLTHEYRRFEYTIRHCNADWTPSDLMEIDYLEGFNGNPVENYEPSMNTLVEYTHYSLRIPNEQVRLTRPGNYEVAFYDRDGEDNEAVAIARFSLLQPRVAISATVSSNTDIDLNRTHQQVSFGVNYKGISVSNPAEEIKVVVQQNNRTDNQVAGIKPTYITGNGVRYEHNRALIFDAGNEYRRFEMLAYNQPGMGFDRTERYGEYYHATLHTDRPRRNYVYDEDQNGAFLIRNDESRSASANPDSESDYLLVHFTFVPDGHIPEGNIYLEGDFTHHRLTPAYEMKYNPEKRIYETTQLLKLGYYNYQYIFRPEEAGDGVPQSTLSPTEGNFYQTENEYQIYVYHRPFGNRSDDLIGFLRIGNQ